MIIRKREEDFVMIEQNHHASISGKLYEWIARHLRIEDKSTHQAIKEAIYLHDVGWEPFDLTPFWNEQSHAPYDFITFPNNIKTVLYKHGIDEVANLNHYAALLCSEHYIRFLQKDVHPLSAQFVENERARQKTLIKQLDDFDENTFLIHYELLQFFDNLSLYICLHETDSSAEDIHYFFKKGIPLPRLYGGGNLQLEWNKSELLLDYLLFDEPIHIDLTQKLISITQINTNGFISAWNDAKEEEVSIIVK